MKICPQCELKYPSASKHCFVDGRELVALTDARIGTTIGGRYLIEEVIGEGGMAIVYRARHKLLDRKCAIKILNPMMARDPVVRERFRREAKSAQSLAHPNIIEIFDQGDTGDGAAFIAMELLDGAALSDVIAGGALPTPRALGVMIQMARGIARAHDLGIVHRDLKPENVFVCTRPDGSDLVKLLDFGIARSREDSRLTNAGELFGTPQYMAPERIAAGDAGPSVDLYALGVIFFEVVTATLPFDAADVATFLLKHLKDPPPDPRTVNAKVPAPLSELILQLLAKDPKTRQVDAHRVLQDLRAISVALGCPLPLDPEHDPSSQKAAATLLPPAKGEQWSHRTGIFTAMLSKAYSNSPPRELSKMLSDIREMVEKVTLLRTSAAKEQGALEELDHRGRDGRQRFGFAVDALGIDASKAKGDVRAAEEIIAALSADTATGQAQFRVMHKDMLHWEGRSGLIEPHVPLAEAYRACAVAVDEWHGLRKKELRERDKLETLRQVLVDLEYQITALRTALANHEKRLEQGRAATEAKIMSLNHDGELLEAKLLALALKFCEPLRSRPELQPLFFQLENAPTG